jgi:uncharacterized protein (TIGR01777 family)
MKVLIPGGSGLIGKALTKNLLADGHEVVILSRSAQTKIPAGARLVQWDAKTPAGWSDELSGADAIVNLAGATLDHRWTDSYKKTAWESRENAGHAIAAAVEQVEQKPRVLIQSSAGGYYGPRDDAPVSEDTPPGDDFLASICAAWEASSKAVEAQGVRRAIIRSGIVLSMEGGALPRLVLPMKLFAGGPIGSGKQMMSWIHIDDEVKAIRTLIDDEAASGVFNLTAPNQHSNRDFIKTLGKVMKRPALMPAPGFALKIMFGEMSTVVLDGQRVLPERLQALGFQFEFSELQPALADLLR